MNSHNRRAFFPVDGVRRVVEASKVNPSTRPPYGIGDPLTEPHILIVKDDGIYLLPHYEKEEGAAYPEDHVVYAEGFNPKVDDAVWEMSRVVAGGDDFAEAIPTSQFESVLGDAKLLRLSHMYVEFDDAHLIIGVLPSRHFSPRNN